MSRGDVQMCGCARCADDFKKPSGTVLQKLFSFKQIFSKFTLMSRNYKFHDQERPYFVTFSIIRWINVFTRRGI